MDLKMSSEDQKTEIAIRRDLGFVEAFGKKESQQTGIRGELLKFIRGSWYVGADQKNELELGTRMIVNLDTLTLGWQRWEDNKPVDSEMGLLVEGYQPVKREQLSDPPGPNGAKNPEWPIDEAGNLSDPWQESRQVLMKDMDGELYTFASPSKGARTAIGKLVVAWAQKMRAGYDDIYPVVALGADTYKHKKFGLIDFPVFELVDWSPSKDFGVEKVESSITPAANKSKEAKATASKPAGRGRDIGY
jgi:hypothetical protein